MHPSMSSTLRVSDLCRVWFSFCRSDFMSIRVRVREMSRSWQCPTWICDKDSEFIVISWWQYCIQSELESASEVQTEPGKNRWDSRRFFDWTEGQNSLRFFEFCISRQTGSKLLFLQNLRQDRIKKKLC